MHLRCIRSSCVVASGIWMAESFIFGLAEMVLEQITIEASPHISTTIEECSIRLLTGLTGSTTFDAYDNVTGSTALTLGFLSRSATSSANIGSRIDR